MKWIVINHYNQFLGSKDWNDLNKEYNLSLDKEPSDMIELYNEGVFTYLIPVRRSLYVLVMYDDILVMHEDFQILQYVLLPRLHFSKIKTNKNELQLFSDKLNTWISTELYII